MARITNKDIARMAGVSPAAVSLAINGRKGISEATRQRILKIAEAYHYTPNPSSRRLIYRRTNNIAILFRRDTHPIDGLFYVELNQSILDACQDFSYNLVFTQAQVSAEAVRLPDVIRSRDVDGVIIYGDTDERLIAEIEQYDIPLVTLDNSRRYGDHLAVQMDYSQAAYTATAHLISLGHRDIAYIGNDAMHYFNSQTFNGFRRATVEGGLTLSMDRVQMDVADERTLHRAIDALISSSRPTAVFCATDLYAIRTMRRLAALGISVPGDISVAAVDDILVSQFTTPALTTVRVDRAQMGRLGLELLQKRIQGEPCQSVVLPSDQLIRRESTAPPRCAG